MVTTNEEIASKIVYLILYNFIPNFDNLTSDVQNVLRTFYYNTKVHQMYDSYDPFWFTLAFCNYQVTDKFVREVNREFKRFKILNISKGEF